MLLFAILKNPSMSWRSFVCSPLFFPNRLCFAVEWRSRRRIMKWWMKGIAIPRWTSRPLFVSRVFAVAVLLLIIVSIAAVQALNLLYGRMIKNQRKLMSQPKITFVSSNGASDSSLFWASIVSLGMGLFGSNGCEHVSNMRRGTLLHQKRLSKPSISTTNNTKSSMKISFVPLVLTSMATINSCPSLKGMSSSNLLAGGTRCYFLPKSIVGSHCWKMRVPVRHLLSSS